MAQQQSLNSDDDNHTKAVDQLHNRSIHKTRRHHLAPASHRHADGDAGGGGGTVGARVPRLQPHQPAREAALQRHVGALQLLLCQLILLR